MEESDMELFDQLPGHVKDSLFRGYLFMDFLKKFRSYFRIVNGSKFGIKSAINGS